MIFAKIFRDYFDFKRCFFFKKKNDFKNENDLQKMKSKHDE